MKNIKIIAGIFLILTAFTFTSCENEPIDSAINLDDFNNDNSEEYYIIAKQDGVDKGWIINQASYFSLGVGTKSLIIEGVNASKKMSLHITNNNGISIPEAVYPLDLLNVGGVYTQGTNIYSSNYSDLTTSVGDITITEFNTTNKTVKGTFSFIAKNEAMTETLVFTNGEFFAKYLEQ